MSFKKVVSYSATNTSDAVVKIKDQMLLMGWTMHDDGSGDANPYYVLKSYGEDSTADVPIYVMVRDSATADKTDWRAFLYWNSTTHAGVAELGTSTTKQIYSDDDASFYMWIYGCKDWVIIVTKIVATYYSSYVMRFNITTQSNIGELQSASGTGADKVLQLGSGETSTFVVGRHVGLVCVDGSVGRQYDLVTSDVDRVNDTITISTSISYDFPAGSFIGDQPCHWIIGWGHTSSQNYHLRGSGTGAQSTSSYISALISVSFVSPDYLSGLYGLIPIITNYNSNQDFAGVIDKGFLTEQLGSGSYEDTVATEKRDGGTVTSSSNNSIDSTGHNWITNDFSGKAIIITNGSGIGQIRDIVSNTDEQIIIDENWTINPGVGDNYIISDRAYRHFGWNLQISIQEGGEIDI